MKQVSKIQIKRHDNYPDS
jgi:hypothetical protein